MAAAQQDRQPVVLGGDDPGERGHRNTDRNDARDDCRAGRAPYLRLAVACLQQRVADDQQRKSAVPDHVEPDRGLRSRAEQPAGREQAGKGQGVDDGRHGREQISAREQQQRPRAGNRELRKQQDGGDQVVDGERGLIARNECRDRGKRHAGKRHGAGEQHRRDDRPRRARPCDRGRSPAWSKERCCARHPLSSPANWQRTRHGNSFKNRAENNAPTRPDIQPIAWKPRNRCRWNRSPEATLASPRRESTQGYILPDDAGRRTRQAGNRLFTDRLNNVRGTAETREFSS